MTSVFAFHHMVCWPDFVFTPVSLFFFLHFARALLSNLVFLN